MKRVDDTQQRPGRPRSFDRDDALQAAMETFWRHGYESTSMRALTDSMGITAPSLYAAFGSKRELFSESLERYRASGPVTALELVASAERAIDAARGLLEGSAAAFTQDGMPSGCLIASAASSCSPAAADVQAELAAVRIEIEAALRARIEAEVEAGLLPASTDAHTLAALVTAVIQGMSTLARDGAPRARLLQVADAALAAWPASVES